jgi:hypothetical protein
MSLNLATSEGHPDGHNVGQQSRFHLNHGTNRLGKAPSLLPDGSHGDILNSASILARLKEASAESNACQAIKILHMIIDATAEMAPLSRTHDYSLCTRMGDTSIDEIAAYSMRDAIQWWEHWYGSLVGNHWKHIYLAFSTIPEDIVIPPQHLLDGTFCLLGNSFSDMLSGLRKENVPEDAIAFMEKCILRQYIAQYIEKQDTEPGRQLGFDTQYRARWRDTLANTYGATTCLLVANKSESLGVISTGIQMTVLMDKLSEKVASNPLITADSLEFRRHRQNPDPEFQEVYSQYLKILDVIPTAPLLSRSVLSGLHVIPHMDGARERVKQTRFPMSTSLHNKVYSYIR